MQTDRATLTTADWDALEQEVVGKIRILKNVAMNLADNPVSDRVCNDLIYPCLHLLAEFCAGVQIETAGQADA